MMRFINAQVRGGRLTLDEPTELPEGTRLKLVSADDIVNSGGDLLEDLEASFAEEAGQLADLAEDGMTTYPITFDAVTDEHIRWYQKSMPDSSATRDVIMPRRQPCPCSGGSVDDGSPLRSTLAREGGEVAMTGVIKSKRKAR